MKTIVIGAGPAGLTAAYQMSKRMPEVVIFEVAGSVGGLARSITLWDQTVDLGPHRFFSHDRRVNEFWLEIVGRDYVMIPRQTRILYQGKLFRYPLEAGDTLARLGVLESLRCLGSYTRNWIASPTDDGTFESWVCRRFGQRLFEKFFKTYSEKLWGIPCRELDADFAAQRIKQLSLAEAVKGAFLLAERKKHRTLADEFAYPLEGTGSVYRRMAEAVQSRGGELHLQTPVQRVLVKNGKVTGIELASGARLDCEQLISTMPLTTMARQLEGAPAKVLEACRQLQFRNTILVYVEVLNENPFTDNWIYVHSAELRFGRVTNFRNWVPQLCGNSPHAILAMEYWCDADDDFWRGDEQKLETMAKEEIVKSGLVSGLEKLGRSFVFRVPKCYPVYRRGYQEHIRLIREYLQSISGLQVIGRYGSFKYNNQDHSILMGLLAAENCISGTKHDLWGVNADYDVYQESCSITQTGLVSA